MKPGYYYLATPYSHPDPAVREQRAQAARRIARALLDDGILCYSPIWHWHQTAVEGNMPTDHEFWMEADRAFIDGSEGVIVAQIEGWFASKGVRYEKDYASEHGLSVYTVTIKGEGNDLRVTGICRVR